MRLKQSMAVLLLTISALPVCLPSGAASIPGHTSSTMNPQIPLQPQTPQTPQIPIIPVTPKTPIIPQMPQMPVNPMPINPRDINPPPTTMESLPNDTSAALGIVPTVFPQLKPGSGEGIAVKYRPGSQFARVNDTSVSFTEGAILVSVRRPTRLGLVETPLGEIALAADSCVQFSYEGDVLRVTNLTGNSETVRIKIKGSDQAVALRPGYEFVASDRQLGIHDIRPGDGFARRHCKVLEGGQTAVSEILVQSVLQSSDLIASLNQSESDEKDKKLLSDMSKMAAVLNYVQGVQGYQVEPRVTLEVKSEIATGK